MVRVGREDLVDALHAVLGGHARADVVAARLVALQRHADRPDVGLHERLGLGQVLDRVAVLLGRDEIARRDRVDVVRLRGELERLLDRGLRFLELALPDQHAGPHGVGLGDVRVERERLVGGLGAVLPRPRVEAEQRLGQAEQRPGLRVPGIDADGPLAQVDDLADVLGLAGRAQLLRAQVDGRCLGAGCHERVSALVACGSGHSILPRWRGASDGQASVASKLTV